MKDVKINISTAGFPSQFVSDAEKASDEYGLWSAKPFNTSGSRRTATNAASNQWRDFNRLRLYARGEQSIGKYKNELAIDGDLRI